MWNQCGPFIIKDATVAIQKHIENIFTIWQQILRRVQPSSLKTFK